MIRICPNPQPWNEVYQRLMQFTDEHECVSASPPKPLILAGWVYSNDVEKKLVWEMTVEWATDNGCLEIVENIPENEFYYVDKPTTYSIGPMGGPMYRPWDFESRERPSSEVLEKSLEILLSKWPEIAGKELSDNSRPLKFTGKKARRLLIRANPSYHPSWGGWNYLSHIEAKRRMFTKFRTSVNQAITPHEVDHIDFVVGEIDEQ